MKGVLRELHWASSSQMHAVRKACSVALNDWAQWWCPDLPADPLQVDLPAPSELGVDWQWIPAPTNRGMWRRRPRDAAARLISHWLAVPDLSVFKTGDWALAAAAKALIALDEAMLTGIGDRYQMDSLANHATPSQPEDLLAAARKPFSGAMVVRESSLGLEWLLIPQAYRQVFSPRQSSSRVDEPTPLQLTSFVSDHRIGLKVELESLQISLDDVLSLEVGDVLCFAHKLHDPLAVAVDGNDGSKTLPRMSCRLAQAEGRLVATLGS